MSQLDDCACCAGTTVATPATVHNRPGLSAIAYRVGTHAGFKRSMLARLAAMLAELRTREDDDFAIALLDAWATVGDVLTFYQERIGQESYLRTATERLSVLQLARLIGYELAPGVASETHLAFTLEDTPGAPAAVVLEPGLRVQSVPGPGEKAQTFETVERIEARQDWSALRPRMSKPEQIEAGDKDLYLKPPDTPIQVGDAILIVGDEREIEDVNSSDRWEFQILTVVTKDPEGRWTKVGWDAGLEASKVPLKGPKVVALGQRAALFGHNAPQPKLADPNKKINVNDDNEWPSFDPPPDNEIQLDAVYPRMVTGRWLVLAKDDVIDPHPYKAQEVHTWSEARFALSGRITVVHADTESFLEDFEQRRRTSVFMETERLTLAERPLTDPVANLLVDLATKVEGLDKGRFVAISGKETADGPRVTELAELAKVEQLGGHTRLHLVAPLKHSYLRHTVTINANVALATHGETVREVLGGGDPSQPFQRFALKQLPLTYVTGPPPSGRASTLELRVNDLLWHEVPALYEHSPDERVYEARTEEGGGTTVLFGDGTTGGRLPRGADNVRAVYRRGIGVAGNVKAGQLTTLLTRPLGLKEVTNPEKAAGGEDPESLADARRNAPVTVLTLDRVVSLTDYQDFARSYPGFEKALGTWTWEEGARSVFLTVAGPGGELPTDKQIDGLAADMTALGDPYVRLRIAPCRPATFRLGGHVKVHPDHLPHKVLAHVEASLRTRFSFDARDFGQPVWLSEVVATVHDVAGVEALDLDSLHRTDKPPALSYRLLAEMPTGSQGAEILTLDPGPLGLTVVP